MPERPIPRKIVTRLRRNAVQIGENLHKLRNLDPRAGLRRDYGMPAMITQYGFRIRQLRFGKQRIIVKRIHRYHEENASGQITQIRQTVINHNKSYRPKNYRLLKPYAYALNDELVAMVQSNKPNVDSCLDSRRLRGHPDARRFFESLKKNMVLQRNNSKLLQTKFKREQKLNKMICCF
jgi:hypothetical protein